MNKELTILESRKVLGKNFRVYGDKENPLFLAKDVANWIENKQPTQMVELVDSDEKLKCLINTSGQNREMWFLTEDGLYEVLMQSRKPIAKQFKKEVKKILKQIRVTGGAVKNEEEFIKNYFPSFSDEVKQAMVLDLKAQNEKIQKELEEKNNFINQISASNDCILVRDLAHIITKQRFNIGEKRLWKKLREWKLIQKDSTKPYQRALEQGLFEVSEFAVQTNHGVRLKSTTRVTGKGQVYIIERLLKENREIA